MRKKTCAICGKRIVKDYMTFVEKSNGYICNHCKEVKSYNFREFKVIESINDNDMLSRSIGFELEVVSPTDYAILELIKRGFNSTHDSTVDIEFKSPIYKSKSKLIDDIMFIDKLLKNKDISIDSCCGTHIRVGNVKSIKVDMSQVKKAIANISVDPFYLWLFGRSICHYANTSVNERTCMINTSNISKYDAIEYRLPRFRDAKRFSKLVSFLFALTNVICDNNNIGIYDLCYKFRKQNTDLFKRSNFDYYASKVKKHNLNINNKDMSEATQDFIYDEIKIYDSLDDLQDYTTVTLGDLHEFFDSYTRLDDINNHHFACYDDDLVYCYKDYGNFLEWVIEEYKDEIQEYLQDNLFYDCNNAKDLYNDIRNNIDYSDYIRKYCI